jgi:hypothetical protein
MLNLICYFGYDTSSWTDSLHAHGLTCLLGDRISELLWNHILTDYFRCFAVIAGSETSLHLPVKRVYQWRPNLQQYSSCQFCHPDNAYFEILLLGGKPSKPKWHPTKGCWWVPDQNWESSVMVCCLYFILLWEGFWTPTLTVAIRDAMVLENSNQHL